MNLLWAGAFLLGTAAVLGLCEFLQRRFFRAYVATYGTEPRERPWLRFGLGMDDFMVGPWDLVPAWRALRRTIESPRLRSQQRLAVIGLLGGYVWIAVAFLLAISLGAGIGAFGVLLGWSLVWVAAGPPAWLMLSRKRPDAELLGGFGVVERLALLIPFLGIALVFVIVALLGPSSGR
jgi:hypothetical protein